MAKGSGSGKGGPKGAPSLPNVPSLPDVPSLPVPSAPSMNPDQLIQNATTGMSADRKLSELRWAMILKVIGGALTWEPFVKFLVIIISYGLFLFMFLYLPIAYGRKIWPFREPPPQTSPIYANQSSPMLGGTLNRVSQSSIENYKIPRIPKDAGRADMVVWFDPTETFTDSSTPSIIYKSKVPTPIEWVIDPADSEEYIQLPMKVLDKFKANNEKLIVKIPYDFNGNTYSPNCSKATYGDGTPAKDLISDAGDRCVLQEHVNEEHKTIAYRPKGFTYYDKFATKEDPMC